MRNKFVVWVLEKFKDEREIQGYERAYMAKVYCKRYASGMPPFFLFIIQVSHVSSTRPERAEAPSPGHRPGLLRTQTCRPVRAKALKLQAKHKAFALTGRLADCDYTQGDALG